MAHPPFHPARGLEHPHAQTIFASLLRGRRIPLLRRERLRTPDGDFVDVDILPAPETAPRLLLLHGLEGSSDSGYVREQLRLAQANGWGAWALNFRGCSGTPNLQAHSYNSGDWKDARFVAEVIRQRHPRARLFASGYSLGGSVLLNLLSLSDVGGLIDAAAAVSAPFDLSGCADLLDQADGLGAVYRVRFLRTLRVKGAQKAKRWPARLDAERIARLTTIRGFDDVVTGPLGGFRDAADYYAQSSTGPKLSAITTPTLLLTAGDDPLAPARHLPANAAENEALTVQVTEAGGHCGFVAGTRLSPSWWGEARVFAFFETRL
jgi:uncharacterized protein